LLAISTSNATKSSAASAASTNLRHSSSEASSSGSSRKARAAATKDPAWQAYLAKGPAKLAEMHSTLLLPTNYSPLK